jgi:hypothetical protein
VPSEQTIWKRRAVLMGVVGLLVAIPLTIAIRGGDEGGDVATPESPEVGALEFDREVGIELRLPEGWRRGREGDAVTFRSRDGDVLIAVTTPGPAEDAAAIHKAAVAAVRSRYRAASVESRREDQTLGGLPAKVAAISARHPEKGSPIRILVATAEGEDLAYLVEVFAAGNDPSESLVEGQALLENMTLEG